MIRKRIFSGIQPSGVIHIGNYLGAITQFVAYQNQFDSTFCIVDLHAITVPQNPKELTKNIYRLAALYLACGINPEKSNLFIQSHIAEHAELAWILNTIATMGELERMTQYKEKAQKNSAINSSVGLFDYPVLMAADILLYNTDIVPVGEDQKQHVELCRNLAQRFNKRFGDTFKVPNVMMRETGARIMALDNPDKKMSKSAESEYNYIAMTDEPDTIRKKISRAVTDSGSDIRFETSRIGLYNLLTIYQLFSDMTDEEIEGKFVSKGYGDFKKELAELIIEKLTPIQEKYKKLIIDKNYLDKILREGADKVRPLAEETIKDVKEKIGLVV
jgi:tryptophanyl-tRNA synthetase